MRRFRTQLAAAAVFAVAIMATAACSGTAKPSTPPSSSTGSGSSAASDSAAINDPSALLSGPTHYPFTFTQPDGSKVTIDKPPTRIVTTGESPFVVDSLVALGVAPIGGETKTGYPTDSRGVPIEVAKQVPSFANLGTVPFSPDLDSFVAIHPDLIVGSSGSGEADIKQLEAIAPFVSIDTSSAPASTQIQGLAWYPLLRMLAQILNRPTQFNAFITKFEAEVAKVRPALAGKTVSDVTLTGSGIYVYGPTFYSGNLLRYLGLTVMPIPPGGKTIKTLPDFTILSPERVSELTGQYIAVYPVGESAAAFEAGPLAKRLPSVKAGRVVAFGGSKFNGFPIGGCIAQLEAVPLVAQAFETAGTK